MALQSGKEKKQIESMTEEEKERRRERARELNRMRANGEPSGLGGKKRIKKGPIVVTVETFEKWYTQSFSVFIVIHINYIVKTGDNLSILRYIEKEIKREVNKWVKAQDEYSDEHICVPYAGSSSYSTYEGNRKTVTIDLTIKQKCVSEFKDAYKLFESKLDSLISSLTTILENNGITLAKA